MMATVTALAISPLPASASTSACQISEFPAAQASQSSLNWSCLFTNAAGAANELSTAQTFHDFANVSYHVGGARTFTVTTATAAGGNTITATGAKFTSADVGRPVSGKPTTNPGIAPRAFIKTVTSATQAVMNVPLPPAVVGPPAVPAGTLPIGTVITLENSTSRSVKDAVHTTSGGTGMTSATAQFLTSDVGKTITGTNIKPGTTIASRPSTTSIVLSQTTLACGATPLYACTAQVINIANNAPGSTTRTVQATQSTTLITAAGAGFEATDIGLPVTGTGIPAGATIVTVPSATTATVSAAMTAKATASPIVIGKPNATAPADGSAIMNLGVSLALSPGISPGAQSCASGVPTGFGLQGQWRNPGTFATGGLIQAIPAGQKVIGQIVFTTTLVFAAYVVQTPTDAAIAAPHYDIVWPFLPTGLAKCGSPSTTNVLSSFTVAPVVASQNATATGIGRPSTAQFRYLNPALAAQTGVVAKLVDGTPAGAGHTSWGTITKTCNIPAPTAPPALNGVVGSCQTP